MRIGRLPTTRLASEHSRDRIQRHPLCPPAFPALPAAHSVQLPTPGSALCLPVPAQTRAHTVRTPPPRPHHVRLQYGHACYPKAAAGSPASQAVQSTAPASAEYLPVRQPPSVTTPGTQRRHGAAGISEMELAHTPPSNNTRSITTKPGSHPRTTAAAQGSALTCLARHTDCGPRLRRVFACHPGANHQYLFGCTSSSILTKPGSHSKASPRVSPHFPCLTCRALCAAAHARVRLVLACPSTDTRACSQDTATPPSSRPSPGSAVPHLPRSLCNRPRRVPLCTCLSQHRQARIQSGHRHSALITSAPLQYRPCVSTHSCCSGLSAHLLSSPCSWWTKKTSCLFQPGTARTARPLVR